MQTRLLQHDWVKHVITPVEVLPDERSADPIIFVDPDKQHAAEQNAAYGCLRCSIPMREGFGTNCPGEDG